MSDETKYATTDSAGDLQTLRNLREEQLRRGDVNELRLHEYERGMGGWVLKLEAELSALEKLAPGIGPACAEAIARYPRSDADPRLLKRALDGLYNLAGGAQRVLKENPARVRMLLKKIQRRSSNDFRDATSETMIDIDSREARTLVGCAVPLEGVPEEIKKAEVALQNEIKRALAREAQGAPPPVRLDRLDVKILENPKVDQGETVEAVRSVRPRRDDHE